MKSVALEESDAERGEDGRAQVEDAFAAAVDGMLAIARRETLVLAAALQSTDLDGILIARGRLRWSLACAQQFAACSPTAWVRLRPRLVAVCEAAERWLPQGSTDNVRPERLQHLVQQLQEPGLGLRTICADDALIAAFDLDELPLSGISLREATVTRVTARRARLEAMNAATARITRSDFEAASMRRAILNDAVLEECTLSRANLESTSLIGATLTGCVAIRAVLIDANLEGARFVDCDLRETDFQGNANTPTRGAQFVRCDLRETTWAGRDLSGVSFVACKLFGVHGRVGGLDATIVEQADLSYRADGTRLATKDEVLESWQEDEWTI